MGHKKDMKHAAMISVAAYNYLTDAVLGMSSPIGEKVIAHITKCDGCKETLFELREIAEAVMSGKIPIPSIAVVKMTTIPGKRPKDPSLN